MTFSLRMLGPGDEAVLAELARDDADFDLDGRGAPRAPLDPDAAEAYLADPATLHWIASDGAAVVGHLYAHAIRMRAGVPLEVLLYEIGVRAAHRRRGAGRELVAALEGWMRAHAVTEVWVLADNPGAVEFYRACGFAVDAPAPTYMTRVIARTISS